MPFRAKNFTESVESRLRGPIKNELVDACECYSTAKTPLQKARCVKVIMDVLDSEVDAATRYTIMQACGHRCIGTSTLKKALKLLDQASDLDDLLVLLNEHHVGGGHLQLKDNVIHAAYIRCYCGSVSKTKEPFSETYCHCSCGWYQKLFETILGKPVQIELLGSIIQGDERCEFRIYLENKTGR